MRKPILLSDNVVLSAMSVPGYIPENDLPSDVLHCALKSSSPWRYYMLVSGANVGPVPAFSDGHARVVESLVRCIEVARKEGWRLIESFLGWVLDGVFMEAFFPSMFHLTGKNILPHLLRWDGLDEAVSPKDVETLFDGLYDNIESAVRLNVETMDSIYEVRTVLHRLRESSVSKPV